MPARLYLVYFTRALVSSTKHQVSYGLGFGRIPVRVLERALGQIVRDDSHVRFHYVLMMRLRSISNRPLEQGHVQPQPYVNAHGHSHLVARDHDFVHEAVIGRIRAGTPKHVGDSGGMHK